MRSAELVIGEEVGELICSDEAVSSCDEKEETAGCGRSGGENDEVSMKETAGFIGTGDEEGECFSGEVVVVDLSSGMSAPSPIWEGCE